MRGPARARICGHTPRTHGVLPVPVRVFPVPSAERNTWSSGMGAFGARRSSGKRAHAGIDIYARLGAPVRAIEAGIVAGTSNAYYRGTGAVTVQNADGTVWRYCELRTPITVRTGQTVRAGQVIGYVGDLKLTGIPQMLHLERFRGTLPNGTPARGPLTVSPGLRDARGVPYVRRGDLYDPTNEITPLWAALIAARRRPVLKKGASDRDAVAVLQRALIGAGVLAPTASPIGTFGPATDAALRAWQDARGLVPDGVCGTLGWERLAAEGLLS